jgi:DNA methylase
MTSMLDAPQGKYDTAAARWAGVGPYYAMFPASFADNVIEKYTKPGDRILDPFAGRGTSLFSAVTKNRIATGVEINPVGWVYCKTKLAPASEKRVRGRTWQLAHLITKQVKAEASSLPKFFHHCFSEDVLNYLISAKNSLDWRNSSVDRTLMALILVHLHGKRETSLSNQMRQSKAMSPSYSIEWWKERKLLPPEHDPVIFLSKKLEWRYKKGIPERTESKVFLGDSRKWLKHLTSSDSDKPYKLLFTSPPYYSVTNYFVDQWLRLWMLGYSDRPTKVGKKYENNGFGSKEGYKELLTDIFSSSSNLISENGLLYIRTDARKFTFDTTVEVLEKLFPKWQVDVLEQPYERETQTALFGDKEKKPGEKDIILYGPRWKL